MNQVYLGIGSLYFHFIKIVSENHPLFSFIASDA